MKLDIILRTHDNVDIHASHKKPRYTNTPKIDIVEKCVRSLIKSANKLDIETNILCLDDHSSEECLDRLHRIFNLSKHFVAIRELTEKGHNYSGVAQFEQAKNSYADLVYCIEDDYLHTESALVEMVEDYISFKKLTNNEVVLHPFDDPDNYKQKYIEKCNVILGSKRHWRTNTHTTYTFLTNPEVIRNNWSTFYTLAKHYLTPLGESLKIHENTTINNVWREQVALFTPIPSLALHMQYLEQMDKYIDWKSWWDNA